VKITDAYDCFGDRQRVALGQCGFPPFTAAKRFSRQVNEIPVERVSEAQWLTVILLAWRFRRQMPSDLVPDEDDLAHAKSRLAEIHQEKHDVAEQRRQIRMAARRLKKTGSQEAAPSLDFS
jgi:hypothetical protein